MKVSVYVVIALFGLFIFNRCQKPLKDKTPEIFSLNESNWVFAEKDSTQFLPAKVPGSVHMDLFDNDLIPEPYYRNNEKELQWIGERDWIYKTNFDVDKEFLNNQSIVLCFDGLDTHADVYLNGQPIIAANNYFRAWAADIRQHVKLTDNLLEVCFRNAVDANTILRQADTIPLFDDYVYSRKPAFHFGWDWGPVYITAGIWRPVYIKAWSGAQITDQFIVQNDVSTDLARLQAEVEIESLIEADVELIVSCDEANVNKQQTVSLKKGLNRIICTFDIDQPKLWWSNGLGEPHLYTIETRLIREDELMDRESSRIGVRQLKLVQNPDEKGSSFHFELNGVPVFAKGANYIPQESFQSKVDSADYRRVIQHALDANMNMLRVWGGGFYEEDYFYDLCDEKGLLVWQDFMFACSMYPGETDYLENVRQEAVENVKRLRNHPSVALWCGNNENYIGWQDWRWSRHFTKADSATVWHDYEKLFNELLPEVVNAYDPSKAYWPSSPKYGWGYPVNSDGDVHLWAVWHAQDPFEVFLEEENIGRFMSEYGFQSLPEMKTIDAFTLPADRSIDSEVMKAHQKHRVGYPVIDKYIKRDYNWPKDFESYVYVSQVLQAKGIKMAIEAHRRAMPFCMGTLYWQLNDCWPVASWSSVDYYNRWKALHYKVRDAYANELVSAVIKNDTVEVYLVSDLTKDMDRRLQLKLSDLEGQVIWEENVDVKLLANTSVNVLKKPIKDIIKSHDPTELVLDVTLMDGSHVTSRNPLYFVSPKDLKLSVPEIVSKISILSPDELQIELESPTLVKDIMLEFDELDGQFSDNYFDMLPGEKYAVRFRLHTGQVDKASTLKLKHKSLIDTY
ncbi:glycoside hydrolase family 2 protein [Carboxylicivirga sediminis]|uniref:Beta-mannosidase n=1 Tax=Carboxylicivirga sediminis TaxID=2006564 RepID=A0A941IWQ4_9BACT|nr:glycoside hydrolase family 2 protein [Carboxylicivirga sediminis]MBR8534599.1 glycoside hydrolase family 2 protein [Carboxylicivirga sediminis]